MNKNEINLKIPFAFSTLVAFYFSLVLGGKRKIDISTLISFRESMYQSLLNKKNTLLHPQLFTKLNVISQKTTTEEIKKFLYYYSNFFIVDNNSIILKEDVSIQEVNELVNDKIFNEQTQYIGLYLEQKQFNLLSANAYLNELLKLLEYEKNTEDYYQLLVENPDNLVLKEKIKKALETRDKFYQDIIDEGPSTIAKYDMSSSGLFKTYPDYKKSPVNMNHWHNYLLTYENPNEFSDDDLLMLLSEPPQFAIFADRSVSDLKIDSDFQTMAKSGEMVTTVNNITKEVINVEYQTTSLLSSNHLLFWMTYISKINEMIELYGDNKELNNIKAKLLYFIDDASLSLYEEENFSKCLEDLNSKLDFEDEEFGVDNFLSMMNQEEKENEDEEELIDHYFYYNWSIEAYYLIKDIFECPNTSTMLLKKLIFISTYYKLTKDEEITNILNNYEQSIVYPEYSKIILGNTYALKKRIIN